MTTNTNPVVAALPGAEWFAMFRDDDGLQHGEPIVGWLVYADGNVRPFVFDENGDQADPCTITNFVKLVQLRESKR